MASYFCVIQHFVPARYPWMLTKDKLFQCCIGLSFFPINCTNRDGQCLQQNTALLNISLIFASFPSTFLHAILKLLFSLLSPAKFPQGEIQACQSCSKADKRAAASKKHYRKYHSQKYEGHTENYSSVISFWPPVNKRKQPNWKGHLFWISLQSKINSISYHFYYFKEKGIDLFPKKPIHPQHAAKAGTSAPGDKNHASVLQNCLEKYPAPAFWKIK